MFTTTLQTMVIHETVEKLGMYEALRRVKAIGYNCIEISGHYECNDALIAEITRARRDFDLEVCALSVVFNGGFPDNRPPLRKMQPLRLVEDFDRVVEYCRRLGCRYVRYAGVPVTQLTTMDAVKQYFAAAEGICRKLADHGLKLCLHNHEGEFCKVGGKFLFDWAVELAPSLCFEFDVLGAAHAATDLNADLRKIRGRVPLIHFEDIKVLPVAAGRIPLDQKIRGCPPGEGNVDLNAFLDTAIECGNEYMIVEVSDFYGVDPYDGMALAAENIRRAGYGASF